MFEPGSRGRISGGRNGRELLNRITVAGGSSLDEMIAWRSYTLGSTVLAQICIIDLAY